MCASASVSESKRISISGALPKPAAFYYLVAYNFSSERYAVGPFPGYDECWEAMCRDAKKEYRIDTEQNSYDAELQKDYLDGTIILLDSFPDHENRTTWMAFSVLSPDLTKEDFELQGGLIP